jgi:hypothetical protein
VRNLRVQIIPRTPYVTLCGVAWEARNSRCGRIWRLKVVTEHDPRTGKSRQVSRTMEGARHQADTAPAAFVADADGGPMVFRTSRVSADTSTGSWTTCLPGCGLDGPQLQPEGVEGVLKVGPAAAPEGRLRVQHLLSVGRPPSGPRGQLLLRPFRG